MVQQPFIDQTTDELTLGSKLVPGRRYAIIVSDAAANFDVQYNVTSVGWRSIAGLSNIPAPGVGACMQLETILACPSVRLKFDSPPGTYQVLLQELKTETH